MRELGQRSVCSRTIGIWSTNRGYCVNVSDIQLSRLIARGGSCSWEARSILVSARMFWQVFVVRGCATFVKFAVDSGVSRIGFYFRCF